MSRFIDITGERYNKLKVISFYDFKNARARWLCQCDCGKQKIVYSSDLRSHNVKSCGCLLHKKISKIKSDNSTKRLHYIYYNIKQRCYNEKNPAYKYYGGKGITMCNEWLNDINTFCKWAIEKGYSDNLTIERIDVNGNYEPDNCKWITKTQQGYNKNNSVLYTINNQTKCLSEWCKIYDIDYHVVYKRLKRGNPIELALTKQIEKKYQNKLCKERNDKL